MFGRILSCFVAASVAATVGTGAFAQDLPKTKLSVTGGIVIQPMYRLVEKPFWSDRISKLSNGAIEAQIRGWDELGLKGTEVWHFVRDGNLDGASFHLASNAGEVPINGTMDLAGLSPTHEEHRKVIDAFAPFLEEWYEKNYQMKIFVYWLYQPQLAMCREPMKGLADIKGRKVRVSSKSQAVFMESLGAIPINMSFPEVQTALQNKVIDCGITSAMSAYKSGWYEGTKYLLPLAISWGTNAFMFNLAKWKSLDPKVQAFLTEQLNWLEKTIWAHNVKEGEQGIACMTGNAPCSEGKPANMVLVKITDADRKFLNKALSSVIIPAWAKDNKPEVVKAFNETIGKVVGVQAPMK
jgi:TRAP-type C4-dicarboxylate transport system substrate-binding protein